MKREVWTYRSLFALLMIASALIIAFGDMQYLVLIGLSLVFGIKSLHQVTGSLYHVEVTSWHFWGIFKTKQIVPFKSVEAIATEKYLTHHYTWWLTWDYGLLGCLAFFLPDDENVVTTLRYTYEGNSCSLIAKVQHEDIIRIKLGIEASRL